MKTNDVTSTESSLLNVIEIVRLQESDQQEVRDLGIAEAKGITDLQIYDNFLPLVELKNSTSQEVRDLTGQLLDRLSSKQLAHKIMPLIGFVTDKCFFVSHEAKTLIDKIEPAHLSGLFDYFVKLSGDSDYDLKRMAENLIVKIIPALSLEEKAKQYNYLYSLVWSHKEAIRDTSIKATLEVMETWKDEDLKKHLPEFLVWTAFDSCEISELAASLAFRVLASASLSERLDNLEYMTSFNFCGNKVIRREFRHLALQTIGQAADKELYAKFSLFFLQNLEGKSKEDRTASWKFLLQIEPDQLPIQDLLYCQASGLHRMRHASKKLAYRVSEAVLAQNLETFLYSQNSVSENVRDLAVRLAVKISKDHLREQLPVIKKFSKSGQIYIQDLASCLAQCAH